MNIINLRYSLEHEGQEFTCYSLGFYSYGLKKLILAFKFNKDFLAGEVLGRYMSSFILNKIDVDIDLLTFIPSSKASLKKRGFNQCEVLCNFISKNSNIDSDMLVYKASESKDQIGLDNEKRWINVANSFKVKDKKKVEGKSILIIDDVVTSGATAFYAAKILKEAKAKNVFILTVAKSRV
ncbi:MAG: phosphoribosyltransferase family protein [Peptostreptococcaceae bacterium]